MNQSQAYEICIKRDLLREQVFILGRMGNSKQALAVIINQLGDIEEVLFKFFSFADVLNFNFERDFSFIFCNYYLFFHLF